MTIENARLDRIENTVADTRDLVISLKSTVEMFMSNNGEQIAGHERRINVLETTIIRNGEDRMRALEDARTEGEGQKKGFRLGVEFARWAASIGGAGAVYGLAKIFS